MYNFKITNCDTDSISFCKPNGEDFTDQEKITLLKELNDVSPEFMVWEDDGYYKNFIVLKAKNYVMRDSKGKLKIKGSSLKSSTLEPIYKKFLNEIIQLLLDDKLDQLVNVYNKYIVDIDNIKDITPYSKKMQLSPTTFKSTRTNETKVIDAIKGTEYKSGDRIYVYTTDIDTLKLAEHFDGKYDKDTYYEKLFKTTKRFETVLDVKQLFPNYSLKKNKKLLDDLLKKE